MQEGGAGAKPAQPVGGRRGGLIVPSLLCAARGERVVHRAVLSRGGLEFAPNFAQAPRADLAQLAAPVRGDQPPGTADAETFLAQHLAQAHHLEDRGAALGVTRITAISSRSGHQDE